MIIIDDSLTQEIKDYIESSCESPRALSDFKSLIPSSQFSIIFVDQKNLSTTQEIISRHQNTYYFIFWDGEKIEGINEDELEYFSYINKNSTVELIKKQLNIYFKENVILEKLQYNLNKFYKSKIEGEATFLKSLETKLSDVHKNLVPLRKVVTPNMKLFSKYALGSDIGGEFVDFEKNKDHLFLIMFSTKSYLLSSDLIEIVLQLRQKKDFNYDSLKTKINEFSAHRNESFDFLITKINFKELNVELFSKGYKTIHNSEALDNSKSGTNKFGIKALDKLLFLSPGLLSYLLSAKMKINNIYKNNVEVTFNEVFSEVRNSMSSGLGGPDATMAILEVQKNAFKTI